MPDHSKKVLLIEDDSAIAAMINRYLKKVDVVVLQASDGKDGLDIALREKPDLILLDLRLPVMNGIMFLEALRKDSWGKKATVVALTNDPTEEAINATRFLGIKEYIVKSNWDMDEALNRALIFIDKRVT